MTWIRELFRLEGKREIYRIYVSHTLRGVAYSVVGIYIPIYLLVRGHSLVEVVGFYALLHLTGLILALFVIPFLIQHWGILQTFKLNYLFEVLFLALLFLLPSFPTPLPLIATLGGAAIFTYWVPLNIFLIKNSDFDKMGSDLANFFALPKIFAIVGPLIGAGLVYFVGFWPTFVIAMLGVVLSYLPIAAIRTSEIQVTFHFRKAWSGLKKRRALFFLEGLDNIIEESEWFWGIYVFLLIGSLAVPGIVGSLETIGAALLTFLVGKYANRSDKKVVCWSACGLSLISLIRIFVQDQFTVYALSVLASFAMTAFLVSYFSTIYRSVKGNDEEEFIILREIPTVLGRMVVFGGVLLTLTAPQYYFLLPLFVAIILLLIFWAKMRTRVPIVEPQHI